MASQIVMPKMSETMEEGVVVKWLKREGDRVAFGDALAEIETDKAVLELEATTAGVLRKILAQEDSKVPVGQLIAVIGAADEDISALAVGSASASSQTSPSLTTHPTATPTATPAMASPTGLPPARHEAATRERIDASPLARRMAEEADIDIAQIRGTGPGGRVVKRDIEAFRAQSRSQASHQPLPPIAPRHARDLGGRQRVVAEGRPGGLRVRALGLTALHPVPRHRSAADRREPGASSPVVVPGGDAPSRVRPRPLCCRRPSVPSAARVRSAQQPRRMARAAR